MQLAPALCAYTGQALSCRFAFAALIFTQNVNLKPAAELNVRLTRGEDRMKFKNVYFFAFSILVQGTFALAAHAVENEAEQYAKYCKAAINFTGPAAPSAIEAQNMGFCFGLMDGLRGANYFLKKADAASAFCEPSAFNNSDLAKVFVSGVELNPELKELRGSLAAQIALKKAFPCALNKGK